VAERAEMSIKPTLSFTGKMVDFPLDCGMCLCKGKNLHFE
jgi:hypothetical protein